MVKKLYLGADHAGFELKEKMKKYLSKEYEVKDLGNKKYEKKDDYPKYGYKVAKKISETNKDAKGILFCGSAVGVCIAANKVKGIRAVSAYNKKIAKKSREDDDANILCISGWYTNPKEAKKIIDTWLETEFSNAERHKRRIKEIKEIEEKEL